MQISTVFVVLDPLDLQFVASGCKNKLKEVAGLLVGAGNWAKFCQSIAQERNDYRWHLVWTSPDSQVPVCQMMFNGQFVTMTVQCVINEVFVSISDMNGKLLSKYAIWPDAAMPYRIVVDLMWEESAGSTHSQHDYWYLSKGLQTLMPVLHSAGIAE